MQKKRDEGDVYYYHDTLHTKVHGPEVVAHMYYKIAQRMAAPSNY